MPKLVRRLNKGVGLLVDSLYPNPYTADNLDWVNNTEYTYKCGVFDSVLEKEFKMKYGKPGKSTNRLSCADAEKFLRSMVRGHRSEMSKFYMESPKKMLDKADNFAREHKFNQLFYSEFLKMTSLLKNQNRFLVLMQLAFLLFGILNYFLDFTGDRWERNHEYLIWVTVTWVLFLLASLISILLTSSKPFLFYFIPIVFFVILIGLQILSYTVSHLLALEIGGIRLELFLVRYHVHLVLLSFVFSFTIEIVLRIRDKSKTRT